MVSKVSPDSMFRLSFVCKYQAELATSKQEGSGGVSSWIKPVTCEDVTNRQSTHRKRCLRLIFRRRCQHLHRSRRGSQLYSLRGQLHRPCLYYQRISSACMVRYNGNRPCQRTRVRVTFREWRRGQEPSCCSHPVDVEGVVVVWNKLDTHQLDRCRLLRVILLLQCDYRNASSWPRPVALWPTAKMLPSHQEPFSLVDSSFLCAQTFLLTLSFFLFRGC